MAIAGFFQIAASSLGALARPGYKLGVTLPTVCRWVLLQTFRTPVAWVTTGALLAGPRLLRALDPLPQSGGVWPQVLPWAFPAGLLGAVLALGALSRGRSFLAHLDGRTRFWVEFGAILAAATSMQLPIVPGALLSGAPLADVGHPLTGMLLLSLHLAGLASLLLLSPVSTALHASLFLALVWLLPALAGASTPGAAPLTWLDAQLVLDARAPARLVSSAAGSAGLALIAYLLRTMPVRSASG